MPKQTMSLDEIEALDAEMLTPEIVARCWPVSQYAVNLMAKADTLPFNYIMNGNRVLIPKRAFIKWMNGEKTQDASA